MYDVSVVSRPRWIKGCASLHEPFISTAVRNSMQLFMPPRRASINRFHIRRSTMKSVHLALHLTFHPTRAWSNLADPRRIDTILPETCYLRMAYFDICYHAQSSTKACRRASKERINDTIHDYRVPSYRRANRVAPRPPLQVISSSSITSLELEPGRRPSVTSNASSLGLTPAFCHWSHNTGRSTSSLRRASTDARRVDARTAVPWPIPRQVAAGFSDAWASILRVIAHSAA